MYFEACALPAVLKTGTVRMINFSGVDFIFRFLPVFLILYSLIPPKYRDILLFAGSIFFYASGARLFVFVLLGLVVINYLFGELVYVQPGRPRRASHKKMMFAVILIDVGILILFKMLALRVSASLLPLGLSFYIFKMLSYQADLFRGEINKRPSFFQAAAYFTMFPQISQGPIMRFSQGWTEKPSNIRRQFAFVQRTVPLHKIEDGITFFIMGLAMKVLIADRLGMLWNEIIKIGFESFTALSIPMPPAGSRIFTGAGMRHWAAGSAIMFISPWEEAGTERQVRSEILSSCGS